jgi:hypothetical protein
MNTQLNNNIKKKPGRKPGSGSMKQRINARASSITCQQIQWIKDCSQTCKYMGTAEIIAYLIDQHVLMQELYYDWIPRFKEKK